MSHVFLWKQNKKRNKQKQIKLAKTKKQKFKYGCRTHVFGFKFFKCLKNL